MEDNQQPILPEEEASETEEQVKTPWQMQKESWYDKIPLTLKQLDAIIVTCLVLLGLTFVAIILDVMDIIHLFG